VGRLRGEGWLDNGRRLLANRLCDGRRDLVILDLPHANVAPVPGVDGTVLQTSPASGTALVADVSPTATRLTLATVDGPIGSPPNLNALTGTVWPLALDPTGRRLAVRRTDGARSRLLVHDLDTDTGTEVDLPTGVIRTAGWGARGLHVLFSAPTHPSAVVTVADPASVAAVARPTPGRHDARLERFAGPGGPVEAIVYGPDWRGASHLLVALHGGPEAAWEFVYDPVFQRLAVRHVTERRAPSGSPGRSVRWCARRPW